MSGPHFDPAGLCNDPARRGELEKVARAALSAADPHRAVRRVLRRNGHALLVDDRSIDLEGIDRVLILGFGKAAVPMGEAAMGRLEGLRIEGVLVTNDPRPVARLEVVAGGHPVPDERSVKSAELVLDLARSAGTEDLVLFLISGGGSALLTLPIGGLSLDDVRDTTKVLLRAGVDIHDFNTVRKHLSAVKGGRLARAAAGGRHLITLVISDVVGNELNVIASGPTVPDHSTFDEALGVLDRYGIREEIPVGVRDLLEAGRAGLVPETPDGGPPFDRQTIALVADAGVAAAGALDAARRLGWAARIVTTELVGEAREVGRRLAVESVGLGRGELLIYAGETTVTMTEAGSGGRNQELALAAALELEGRDDAVILALGTDGVDGPTDAAGGFADGRTVERGRLRGLVAADHLVGHDSNTYLAAVGDVVSTGPTGTNVGDLILVARSG